MAPSPTLRERLAAGLADGTWPWPLALSLLAAVPLLDRAAALTLGAWLAASAAAVAWWLHRATPAVAQPLPPAASVSTALHDERQAAPGDPGAAELSGLLTQVLPVWNSHIESVRAQTEQAVDELVLSFAGINAQFEAAGFIGVHDESQRRTTFTLLTLCERQLRPVVSSMGKILESKTSLVNCVNELANATQELKGMANDVRQIAAHTNILAINAAIEAAHAGDTGRGFAVIAKAIRELSQTSAAAGKRIAERMAQIESLMVTTVEKANQTAHDDGEAIEMSGTVVQDVLAHVRALGESAEDMRTKGAEIRRDTDNLLLHLQFQDRTSQILGAVEGDIDRLRDAVKGGQAVPDPQAWLEEMSQRYTMNDQRQATQQRSAVSAAASEIEFF